MRLEMEAAIDQQSGKNWTLYHGDSCRVLPCLPESSVDLWVHSPPFATLYIYSDSEADLGNSADYAEFFTHYNYIIREMYRVTVPSRLCVVHCKDLPLYKGRDGAAGLQDFPGDIVRAFTEAGWTFHSRCTIWKCPVIEMQRTKNHGLLHKQLCKDSTASRQGMADYLLVFRKSPSESDVVKPVTSGNPFARFGKYIGTNIPPNAPEHLESELRGMKFDGPDRTSIQVWQQYASPVWWDINQMRVLNTDLAKNENDGKHICPLQLDVIERCIHLWSNPGDVVGTPFAGIGSEPVSAIKMGRKAIGIELKREYFHSACKFLREAEAETRQRSLFGE